MLPKLRVASSNLVSRSCFAALVVSQGAGGSAVQQVAPPLRCGEVHTDRCWLCPTCRHFTCLTGGIAQVPSSAAERGEYRRAWMENGWVGIGSQFDSLSAPGLRLWR